MHQTPQHVPSDPRHARPHSAFQTQLNPAPEPRSDKTVWDGTNTNPHPNSYADLGPDQPYERWSIKTATASITSIQNIYRKEHKRPLTREDFAKAPPPKKKNTHTQQVNTLHRNKGIHSFFIRTSKFCLRLAVLFFFSFFRLKWS